MKILLLEHPRQTDPGRCNDIANTPLSSSLITGYSAAMLVSQGHEVKIVEGYLEKLAYEEIEQKIAAFQPDLLGIHLVYNWENNVKLYTFLQKIQKQGLVDTIVAYGYYPTFAYKEILHHCPAIAAVILGEPEITFAQLAAQPFTNDNFKNIPGLAWQDEEGAFHGQRREVIADLNQLPFPLRTKAMLNIGEVNLEGSRGCYGGCTFCYINPYYGCTKWRGRSPENIAAEIDEVIAKYQKKDFYFTDPNFFGPGQQGQERALVLAELLKARKIHFGIEARANDIREETIGALVDAGLRHILIGLESGKDASLKRLNKMTTVAQNENALRILRHHGIEPNVGFIMFEPDSSVEDLRLNFSFLQRNSLLNNLAITANVLYHPQIILQGTKAYQALQEAGRLQLRATTYEGMTSFLHPQIANFAQAMSQITNYLFVQMDPIWSGRRQSPENAGSRYSQINNLLVASFEKILQDLEAGKELTDDKVAVLVNDAQSRIAALLED
ncbi:radical SAM protein [Bacillota bacterium LX-D]|nr:radical SAM protein [Bacillota bacterium LX-D]